MGLIGPILQCFYIYDDAVRRKCITHKGHIQVSKIVMNCLNREGYAPKKSFTDFFAVHRSKSCRHWICCAAGSALHPQHFCIE